MSEEKLVFHCAPTLAGIKCGSLFTSAYLDRSASQAELRSLNRRLSSHGIRLIPLRYMDGRVLIYVYRPDGLAAELSSSGARSILARAGYSPAGPDASVAQLFRRFQSSGDFPHEIGLFLGYPAEDVAGYMENMGKNCKCVGTWKVYGDVNAAQARFDAYRRCTGDYCRRFRLGQSSLEQLAAAHLC